MRLWVSLLLLLSTPLVAQTRGYTARACGFDLDDDGIIGEATDDCTLCDGNASTGAFTVDPDGDGDDEDINFVDADGGTDDASCGAPNDACATLSYVLAGSNSSYAKYADGNGDGDEDIICLYGTDNPVDVNVYWDGVTGYRTKTATGSEEYDFRYPTNPAMIVGWDYDMDGEYTPYDTDDVAVLDGQSLTSSYTSLRYVNAKYFEVAHLTVSNYGVNYNYSDGNYPDSVYRNLFYSNGQNEYFYAHDIEGVNQNKNSCRTGAVRLISNLGEWSYAAFENWKCTDCAGYITRGGNGTVSADPGHIRVKNFTIYGYPPQDADCNSGFESSVGSKPWGPGYDYIEWIDSEFYLDPNARALSVGTPTSMAFSPNQCSRWVVFRNNYVEDFQAAVRIAGSDPSNCLDTQTTGPIYIDRNEFVVTNQYSSITGVHVYDTNEEGSNRIEGVEITNNIFLEEGAVNFDYPIRIFASNNENAYTEDILIANNTIYTENAIGEAAIMITDGMNYTYDMNNIIVKNNLIETGGNGDTMISTDYAPTSWASDYNRFYSPGTPQYAWNAGAAGALADWKTSTSDDANSSECQAILISSSNLHLQVGDTCAKDSSTSTGDGAASYFTTDYDDDARPQGSLWDIGADEYESGYTPPDGSAFRLEGITIEGVTGDG